MSKVFEVISEIISKGWIIFASKQHLSQLDLESLQNWVGWLTSNFSMHMHVDIVVIIIKHW